jgi:3D (Asp-Asp-Asp) domain-containing protein
MNIKKILLSSAVALMMTGCMAPQTLAPEVKKPETIAETKITKYSDALENLGELMELYKDSPLYIAVEPVENKTANLSKLPADITVIVESAINKIGRKVILTPGLNEQVLNSNEDYIVLKGAITEFDANVETKSSEFNIGAFLNAGGVERDAEASADRNSGVSSITIDFNVIDPRSRLFIPQVNTSNSMKINKVTATNEIGFSIAGNALGLTGKATKEEGIHSIIRLLVELSIVEIIGNLRSYPYWVAISNANQDIRLLKKMKKDFNRFPESKKVRFVQHLLRTMDYSVGAVGKLDKSTRNSIIKFRKRFRLLPYSGKIDSDLYVKLLEEAPKMILRSKQEKKLDDVLGDVL